MNWTPAAVETLKILFEQGDSYRNIASVLKCDIKSVDNKIQKLGLKRDLSSGRYRGIETIVYQLTLPLVKNLSGNWAVASDLHVPYHDEKMVLSLVEISQQNNIKNLIIAGDLLDFSSISSFISKAVDLNDEIDAAQAVLSFLFQYFEKIVLIPGNHEFRFNKKIGQIVNYEHLVNMFTQDSRVCTSEYDHVILTSCGNMFRVCHPKNYSTIKGRVSTKLAEKYGTNIIAGHSHYVGINVSENGKFIAIDTGGLFNKDKMEYAQRTTLNPEWNQGFCLIVDGRCELYSPLLGNLRHWGH